MPRIDDSAPRTRRRAIVLVLSTLGILAAFCAILAAVMWQARSAAYATAARAQVSLVNALRIDLARNVEAIDLSLQAVADNLNHPDIDRISPAMRQLVLFDRSATARHLGLILVLDEKGNVKIDSRSLIFDRSNYADRDYFQAHVKGNQGSFIGRPTAGSGSDEWFVGLSRRLSHADGSFAGVVMASLRLSFFRELFADVSLGPGGNVSLVNTDGTLLMRWPYKPSYIGRDLSASKLHEHLAVSPSGLFVADTKIDGQQRLVAYAQVDKLPLVIGVGQSTEDIYTGWWKNVIAVGLLISILCAFALVLLAITIGTFRKHDAIKTQLALQATRDGLTELRNRRYLDSVMNDETTKNNRLSLLMIDADHFKELNDRHGHQAGDIALQSIARCIRECLRSDIDIACRYGGEEFLVLLPNTSVAEAAAVAERIRNRVLAEAGQSANPIPTVSIGIATKRSDENGSIADLLKAADTALYAAKRNGRNRVECAGAVPHVRSQLQLAS